MLRAAVGKEEKKALPLPPPNPCQTVPTKNPSGLRAVQRTQEITENGRGAQLNLVSRFKNHLATHFKRKIRF